MLNNVYVVIVTYGDRFKYLNEVVDQCGNIGVGGIVIIDNNSNKNSKNELRRLEQINKLVSVIWLNNNTGSANGYYQGLKYVQNISECKYIWLLDDDNVPEINALNKLVKVWKNNNFNAKDSCLLSLRRDREEYVQLTRGVSVDKIFPLRNSFLGFDIINYFKSSKKCNNNTQENYNEIIYKVPYAPYGGMFFKKESLTKIGLPLKEFFLYSDDHEFSHRFTSMLDGVFLVANSYVNDIEKSWYIKDDKSGILKFLEGDKMRVYYNIRNRVYFERKDLVKNHMIYYINMTIFTLALMSRSFLLKNSNIKIILSAINDGINRHLEIREF